MAGNMAENVSRHISSFPRPTAALPQLIHQSNLHHPVRGGRDALKLLLYTCKPIRRHLPTVPNPAADVSPQSAKKKKAK